MRAIRRFKSDNKGTTGVLFALTLVPVLGCTGAAIDYARASSARVDLQRAVDAAALALVSEASSKTTNDRQFEAKGEALVRASVKGQRGLALDAVTVRRDGKTVRVAAAGRVEVSISRVLGFNEIAIGTNAEATWSTNRIELALVLDNTGSMDESPRGLRKIDELKKASKRLLGDLRAVADDADSVKVSIVPFDTEVRLEPKLRDAAWLHWDKPSDKAKWTGYVWDRAQPYDAGDAAPSSDAAKYPALPESRYAKCWNGMCGDIASVRPLTSLKNKRDYDDLVGTVEAMRPRGYTNIGLGLAWGQATLSPGAPFTEGAPQGRAKKFIVLLTDGDNTWSRNEGFAAGAIDERTRLACGSARADATVYTIRLVSGNASLLRGCASSPDKYFDVTDPSRLEGVFRTIMSEISGTRLSH